MTKEEAFRFLGVRPSERLEQARRQMERGSRGRVGRGRRGSQPLGRARLQTG